MIESGRVYAGRYELDVQVSSPLDIAVWKATDSLLKRPVRIYLIDPRDPRTQNLVKRALTVSKRNERDSISILDVIDAGKIDEEDAIYVGIITEWVDGKSLDQRLISDDALTSSEALMLISHVVIALHNAHQEKISHGHLRPHNVIFADSGEIRISGFGIDAPILGVDSTSVVRADIHGVGQLLFAAVTGMWPHESVDGLPAAQTSEKFAAPSNFASGVTQSVDSIYRRTQDGTFTSMRDVMNALSIGTFENKRESVSPINRLTNHVVTWQGHPESREDRKRATIYALLGVLVFAWVGLKLMATNFGSNEMPEAITSAVASATPSNSASAAETGELATILSAKSFDPLGDNKENDAKAMNVIDGNSSTTWTTVDYKNANLGGKTGIGLVLDLGAPRPVSSVDISFTSPGSAVTVFVTDSNSPSITTATKLASGTASVNKLTVKSPRPISGRYVIVWLTQLPKTGSVWKAGISEITIGL